MVIFIFKRDNIMEYYEFQSMGRMFVEVLNILPIWTHSDIGRLIFDINTNCLYIGSISCWISTSPTLGFINFNHIDWNLKLNNQFEYRIDASDFPCFYEQNCFSYTISNLSNKTNIQDALIYLQTDIKYILDGNYYVDDSIKLRYLDLSSSERIDASNIYLENDKLYFGEISNISIESVLNNLYLRKSEDIYMKKDNTFGFKLQSFPNTIFDSFKAIEDYLLTLNSKYIWANLPLYETSCKITDIDNSSIQCALDKLFNKLTIINFTELTDINYEMERGQFLKSCSDISGITCLIDKSEIIDCTPYVNYQIAKWDWIWASEVKSLYLDIEGDSNIQEILLFIYKTLTTIKNENQIIMLDENEIIKVKESICKLKDMISEIDNNLMYMKTEVVNFNTDIVSFKREVQLINTKFIDIKLDIIDLQTDIDSILQFCCPLEEISPIRNCDCDIYIIIPPSYPACLTPTCEENPEVFDADYLVIVYNFTIKSGTDLDTRSQMLVPRVGNKLGYCAPTSNRDIPYVYWSSDNTGTGTESIYVDLKQTFMDFSSASEVSISLSAWWYKTRLSGDITIDIKAYKGGTMSLNNFTFTNFGGNLVATLSYPFNIPVGGTKICNSNPTHIGNIKYNKATKLLSWD